MFWSFVWPSTGRGYNYIQEEHAVEEASLHNQPDKIYSSVKEVYETKSIIQLVHEYHNLNGKNQSIHAEPMEII
jgi:hypothetical protein